MPIMSDGDRQSCFVDFMRSEGAAFGAVLKAELRAAIDAADQWASDNANSYNSALPLPARTVLTASQKARLLAWVILKRWNVGA